MSLKDAVAAAGLLKQAELDQHREVTTSPTDTDGQAFLDVVSQPFQAKLKKLVGEEHWDEFGFDVRPSEDENYGPATARFVYDSIFLFELTMEVATWRSQGQDWVLFMLKGEDRIFSCLVNSLDDLLKAIWFGSEHYNDLVARQLERQRQLKVQARAGIEQEKVNPGGKITVIQDSMLKVITGLMSGLSEADFIALPDQTVEQICQKALTVARTALLIEEHDREGLN